MFSVTQVGRLDPELCYRAVASRDARFDGQFITAVTSTGIYCRPSCPAITPKRENVIFLPSAAAAQARGFRACRRCRPDSTAGSPQWVVRTDVIARAMRLVVDGEVDRHGVGGVAAALGYSTRQLNRIMSEELGAGLAAIARAQRAQTARLLLETSQMPVSQVAWASGFGSIRQFNDTIREVFAASPSQLRPARGPVQSVRPPGAAAHGGSATGGQRPRGGAPAPAVVRVRLAARQPLAAREALAFLGERAIPGVERWDAGTLLRTLDLPRGHGLLRLSAARDHFSAEFQLQDVRDLAPAVARVRRLLDLDADPVAVHEVLGRDALLARVADGRAGLRVPGSVSAHEMVVRAIVGQQVSLASARTVLGRLSAQLGQPCRLPHAEGLGVFPSASDLAAADPSGLGMPASRARAIVEVARMIATGRLDVGPGADRTAAAGQLLAVPGIGLWTAGYFAMRGLGDPDVLLVGDAGVRRAIARLGGPTDARAIAELGQRWRPWRSYAVALLWASLAQPLAPPAGTDSGQALPEPTRVRVA